MRSSELYDLGNTAMLPALIGFAQGIIASRPPNEIIDRGTPFFERWMLGRKITVPTFVGRSHVSQREPDDPTPMPSEIENIFLHRFLKNDCEDAHCHPWWNISIPLTGSYVEQFSDNYRAHRQPGDWVWREAAERHAIVNVEPGTITLFITGPKEREWGFWPEPDLFVHHREYTQWRKDRGLA
jgi:hypothetical protein